MKNLLAVFVVCLALATASMDAEAARRFGGGSSFGRPTPIFTQKAAPKSAPAAAPSSAQQKNPNSAATTPSTTPVARPSFLRSALTGLAAALGISALLSLFGITGAEAVSFVMGLLLIMVVFVVAKSLFSKRVTTGSANHTAQNHDESFNSSLETREQESVRLAPAYDASLARPGSVMDQFTGGSAAVDESGVEDITPADFDTKSFLETSKENFIKLQKAWETGNVIEISEFTSNDVFIAITHQLHTRGKAEYHTDVQKIKAELLGITKDERNFVASVRFVGVITINGEIEDFDEIWVLEKPVQGQGGWLLAGIKQNEPDQNN